MNMMNIKGKTAIVTGGTRGIGKSICDLFLENGCNVIATGTNLNNKVSQEKDNLFFKTLDFLNIDSTNKFIKDINDLDIDIDILVNNAGINIIEPIDTIKKENWDKIIQVNLTGPMLLSKSVSSSMKKKKQGKILNISSIWGTKSKKGRNAYAVSKTGLLGLTRTTALDLASYNILVNALCPGFTMTDLTKSTLSETEINTLSNQIPLKRFAKVEEIAKLALFLCSDINTYITGQTIIIDGGFTIQ
jgi:3-oxoacyl-[acyl-carrier protein] reductase